jgi:hypothetical protein
MCVISCSCMLLLPVLDAYHGVFKSGLVMSGPTVFTEVIKVAAARAESSLEEARKQGRQTYTILLILTDGSVSDVSATASCLNQVSNSPMSIVIVGVGQAEFSGMQFLDDASGPGKRDIAQFVEFNKYSSDPGDLTAATLREVPDQLVGCLKERGIQPNAAIQTLEDEIVVESAEEEIDLSLDFAEDEIVISSGGSDFAGW